MQKAEELLVVVAEALPEHQAADHIGNRAAQEEGGIKRCACQTEQRLFNVAVSMASVGGNTSFGAATGPLVVSMRATRCLLSSWIQASIPLRPIPKSLKVESVNRLSWRQRSPLLMATPDRGKGGEKKNHMC